MTIRVEYDGEVGREVCLVLDGEQSGAAGHLFLSVALSRKKARRLAAALRTAVRTGIKGKFRGKI